MTHRPLPDRDALPVRLPHTPLPAYYESGNAVTREAFLRRTFDDAALDYDRLERIVGMGMGSWYRRQALLRAGLRPGQRVVDVGMGTGLVSREILKITGEPQHLVGVDPSLGMMRQARLEPAVACRLGRAEDIPLPDASVDFLAMGYALRHVTDFSAAAREFRRVLKPGGRALILEFACPESRLARALLKAYMRGVVSVLMRAVSRSRSTPALWRYSWDTIEACAPPAQIMRTMADCGLHGVDCHTELGIFAEYRACA